MDELGKKLHESRLGTNKFALQKLCQKKKKSTDFLRSSVALLSFKIKKKKKEYADAENNMTLKGCFGPTRRPAPSFQIDDPRSQ